MIRDTYYVVDPEVTGWLDEGQSYDEAQRAVSVGPLRVTFEGWLGDDLIAMNPFWFVTERLALAMKKAGLTGFELDPMTVMTGEQWELGAQLEIPATWFRLIPTGIVQDDDVSSDGELLVNEKALKVLRSFSLTHASIEPLVETSSSPLLPDDFLTQQAEKAADLANEIREPRQKRIETHHSKAAPQPIPAEPGVIAGDILIMFKALGHSPDSKEVVDAQALFGVLGERKLTPRNSVLKKDYLTFEYWHSGAMMQFGNDELLKIVVRVQPEWGWLPFPHSEKLLHGITAQSTREEVRALLGPTVKTNATHDSWQIGTQFLNVWYNPQGLLGRISVLLRINGS